MKTIFGVYNRQLPGAVAELLDPWVEVQGVRTTSVLAPEGVGDIDLARRAVGVR